MSAIRRGDVFRVSFGPAKGHELKDPHYAVVVQADSYPLSTVLVVPLSSSATSASWRVPVEFAGRRTYALVEQLRAVDVEARLRDWVGTIAGTDEMSQIEAELAMILDIRRGHAHY